MPIVTSTYRYKRPPRKKRKGPRIETPAIVTIDPKTQATKAEATPTFDFTGMWA
jgi:hypothetical protein